MKASNRWIKAVIAIAVLGGGGYGIFAVLGGGSSSAPVEAEQADFYYTCPMHPSVVEDKPGDCPICGMSLVKKERTAAAAMDMTEEEHAEHLHEGGEAVQTPEGKTVYTCPMHPSVAEDEPGDCPICGMTLVPKKIEAPGSGSMSGMDMSDPGVEGLEDVTISPRQRVLANIETTPVESRSMDKEIVTVGRFDIDEQRTAHVAAWVGGRIERLYVDFTGAEVRKGQPLLDLYSPALIQTQEEYLSTLPESGSQVNQSEILRNARERLRQGARERLLLWGITEQQIADLEGTRKVRTTTTITAPASGTVMKKMVQEGQYVQQGQTLLDIADLSSIWLYADVYEFEVPFLRLGQKVTVYPDAHPGEPWYGTITFIDPVLDPRTRTVAVRATFRNPNGELKPKMIAQAIVQAPLRPAVVVPSSAVINTGRRQVVWAEVQPNRFSPRAVTLGPRVGDFYQVLSGIEAGAMVATSGGFLLDSESQLKAMAGAGAAGSMPGMDMGAPSGGGKEPDAGGGSFDE